MRRAGEGANEEAVRVRAKNSARGWGCQLFTLLRPGFEPIVGVLSPPIIPALGVRLREGSLFDLHAIVCLWLRCERPFDCFEPNATHTPRLKTGAESPRGATKSWARRVLRPIYMVSRRALLPDPVSRLHRPRKSHFWDGSAIFWVRKRAAICRNKTTKRS